MTRKKYKQLLEDVVDELYTEIHVCRLMVSEELTNYNEQLKNLALQLEFLRDKLDER